MVTSALKLVTGVLDGKSIRNNIEQTSHGFTAGSVVRFDPTASSGNGGFTLAYATSPKEAEVAGIIEKVADANNFTIVYQGEIDISNFPDTGTTADECYFLSGISAGHVSSTAPTVGGHVIKPVLTRRGKLSGGAQRGVVMNYLGTVIGGEATVSLNGLMPVGAIQAYAGNTSGIPAQWSLCDGSTLDATRHADYYTAVSWRYGSWQKFKMPSTYNNTSSLVGEDIKQTFDDGTQADAVIISWDNNSKEMIVDNITHDSTTGKIITEITNKKAQFETTSSDGDGVVTVAEGSSTHSIESVSVHSVKKPDLRSRIPMGEGETGGVDDYFERGQYGGERTHTLSEAEIPSHNHGDVSVNYSELDINDHNHVIDQPAINHFNSGIDYSQFTVTQEMNNFHFVDSDPDKLGGPASGNNQDITHHAQRGSDQFTFGGSLNLYIPPESFVDTDSAVESGHALKANVPDDLVSGLSTFGNDQPHNNLQPYLVTHYIIRISSEARASLIDGIDLTVSMEGLSNVNDGDPANDEMVRYNSTDAEYEKFSPVIQGIGSKDNEDVVIHTSQGTDGSTQEAMRFSTDGKVYLGLSLGYTGGLTLDLQDTLMVLGTAGNASYAFFQGGGVGQTGSTGSHFGHSGDMTVIWNSAPTGGAGSGGISFLWGGGGGTDLPKEKHRLTQQGLAIGGGFAVGASLDVSGTIRASGDIYTHHENGAGGTFGIYASELGITGNEYGGYNFPVTGGNSGDILMLKDENGTGITTAIWTAFPSSTNFLTGTDATGISFDKNVGVATGGTNAAFGATLEVGGGGIFRGAVTADSLYLGAVEGSNMQNALIAGLTAAAAWVSLKS